MHHSYLGLRGRREEGGKGSCCPKLTVNRAFTVYRLVQEFKSKLILKQQFCSPRLVLSVGGRASRRGGGGGGRVNKVPGLTLIVHNLEMNKHKFINQLFF